jgi:hypothetical protein
MNKEKLEKELKEAQEDLAALKKMKASPDEIEFQESEVAELEAKLKSAPSEKKIEPAKKVVDTKPVVKKTAMSEAAKAMRGGKKYKVKKAAPVKAAPVKVETKPISVPKMGTKKVSVSKVPVKKSKGLSVIFNGKTYLDTDPNFCEILIKQLEERKKKRKETGGKVKTHSLSAKVGDNIASSVVTAIKGAFKENKNNILDNKASANKFLKTIQRIENAADRFVGEMKSILNDSFKQKDFDKEFKEVDEVVKKIKDTIKKSVE